ncbi:MAG: radical SAM protein, partial [Clostridia bacterium]|nr:radical SAM protein [Clostridia bacterium]
MNEPKFRAKQLFSWLQSGKTSFDEMTNIPLSLRNKLNDTCYIADVKIVKRFESKIDSTVKYVFSLYDGEYIESVFMKYEHGYTVCISTQVGCRMGCKFCASGLGGLVRNLTASEMLSQIMMAAKDNGVRISNVVMMGMGEPLDNLDEVLKVLEIMTASYGFAWSPKRITLSTVGLRKGLKRFIEESDCHLAISLHAPVPQLRQELMPAEKAFSITEI